MNSLDRKSSAFGVVEKYGSRLDIDGKDNPITIGEGSTPLIPVPRLAKSLGIQGSLFIKFEGLNPTGSFKDRGMTAALTDAVAKGARTVICASTGNTAASAAAYAARAGIHCAVLIPEGKVALGKLAGAIAYGADVIQIEGSFDDALTLVRELTANSPIALVNSVNPARIQGQKTGAWEIQEALGDSPDWLCLPVGNAGNITSYWLGFRENRHEFRLPRLLGTQASGAAPFIHGHFIEKPETMATAIRIGKPARWEEAKAALSESNGCIFAASDEEILAAYRLVSSTEGIFCEPSSAAGLAGIRIAIERQSIDPTGTFVAILTGHGLKDADTAINFAPPLKPIPPTIECLAERMGL